MQVRLRDFHFDQARTGPRWDRQMGRVVPLRLAAATCACRAAVSAVSARKLWMGPCCAAAPCRRNLCLSCCICSLSAQALDCRYRGNPPVLTLMADMTFECASTSPTAIPPEFLRVSPGSLSGGSSSEMWMLHIVGAIVFIGMRHERIIIIMQSPSSGLLSIPLRTPRAVSGSCGLQCGQGLWMQGLLLAFPLCFW